MEAVLAIVEILLLGSAAVIAIITAALMEAVLATVEILLSGSVIVIVILTAALTEHVPVILINLFILNYGDLYRTNMHF